LAGEIPVSWDCFLESSSVNWVSFEVSSVFLGAKRTLGGTMTVFGAHVLRVVTTTLYAFRFAVASNVLKAIKEHSFISHILYFHEIITLKLVILQ